MNDNGNNIQQNNSAPQSQNQNYGCLIAFVVIIIILAILGFILPDSDSNKKSDKSSMYISCYFYSQDLVKKQLKSPKSADFPWYSDSFIKDKGDTILVSAYVDADNSFGANIRTNYIASIKVKDGEPVSGYVVFE